MELSEKEAAQSSAAVITRALENPPACAARSEIPPSILDLSALDLLGGSWVANYSTSRTSDTGKDRNCEGNDSEYCIRFNHAGKGILLEMINIP